MNFGDDVSEGVTAIPTEEWPGLVLTLGSGKFGSPWLRMQRENAYAAPAPFCELPCADCPVVAEGPFDPHPAASTANPATSAASAARCLVRLLIEIVLLAGFGVATFLEDGR